MSYTHLTDAEWYGIYEKRKEGATLAEIAKSLRCNKSTISRKIGRNSGQHGYRPNRAHELTAAPVAVLSVEPLEVF